MTIGREQKHRIAAMRETVTALRDTSPDSFKGVFDAQLGKLNGWAARIAVIGQVKAGKSSTLNALVGEIDFLPSDVNPWTTVVTNLRINMPGDPKTGARFDFFDEASWDRIINGDRRVRKAARKHLPGFDPEILRTQTEEMRAYAEKRLGPSYAKLLGRHHAYDLLSDDLLESYVCAGAGTDLRGQKGTVGRYSSITKAANIYLDIPQFQVPTILTDTPGVNDPFLVRDEFTCQALDQSDIFLVMLSAHQALTEVDVALMRMLAMQDGKDVIVYINRIDELEDRAARIERIVADVSVRIREAVPEGRFTILHGSARWAEAAMDEDMSDADIRALIVEDRIDEFASERGLDAYASPRARLFAASGLPEVKRALSAAIDTGSGARFLDRIEDQMRAQIGAVRTLSQRQRNDLQDRIDMYVSGRVAECREAIEDEMTLLASTHSTVCDIDEAMNVELDKAINDHWVALQREMDQQIANFIESRKKTLRKLWSGTGNEEAARIDLLPLRVALESAFHLRYDTARRQVDKTMGSSLANAAKVASRAVQGIDGDLSADALPGNSVAVTFATSARELRVDLIAQRSWKFWREKEVDLDRTMEGLRSVTAAEVFPATSKMVTAFMDTLSERVLAGKARLDSISRVVEHSLNDRIVRLREDYKMMQRDDTPEMRERLLNRLRNDIEVIDGRLRVIAVHENVIIDPDDGEIDTAETGDDGAAGGDSTDTEDDAPTGTEAAA